MKTKRAILISPRKLELQTIELGQPTGHQLLIKVAYCGLCNFELNHWKGLMGSCPQSLGHEWNGTVVSVGESVTAFKPGDRIAMLPKRGVMTGFSEYSLVDEDQCWLLPEAVSFEDAICEPLKCVVTVIRAAAPEAGDYAVVQGCGPMGLWCISLLAGSLCSGIIALDIDDEKLEVARRFGATYTINTSKSDAKMEIAALTHGHMADFVIEGTGIPALLETCVDYLRKGRGRLVLMSSHESAVSFDFRKAIDKGIALVVSHAAYSLDQKDDMRRTIALLERDAFHIKETITHEFTLDDIQTAFETLEHKPQGYIKGVVKLREQSRA